MKPTELIEQILKLSKVDDCIVIVEEASNVNLRWANNTSTTNGIYQTREVVVLAIRDRRVGMVQRNFVDENNLEDLVREAEAACDFQQPAEDYAELIAGDGEPNDWNESSQPTTEAVLSSIEPALTKAFAEAKANKRCLFGYAEHSSVTSYVGNSRGLRRRHHQLKGQFEMTAKTADFTSSAWIGQATTDFADVDVADLTSQLMQRLDWSATKLDLPAGRYDTVLQPSALADLLLYAYLTGAARDAAEGRNVYSKPGGTRIGEQLAAKNVNLYSDPAEPGLEVGNFELTSGSSAYSSVFDNGNQVGRTEWIKDGVLQHLITPRYWAASQKIEATPYVDNLIMTTGGTESLDELIAGVKRGLLVTCLWYIREVDPRRLLLTGLTRDGVFLIEDGQVKGAVNNFRFNMSPVELLNDISQSGATVPTLAREFGDYFSFTKVPPVVVEDFNMSSVSKAT